MKTCSLLFLFLVLLAIPIRVQAEEVSVPTSIGANEAPSQEVQPKLTLEQKRSLYVQDRNAFRSAQRAWVLSQLDANSTSEDAALLEAQFVRDNFEWRLRVGEYKFDYQHAAAGAESRRPTKAALAESLGQTVRLMKDAAETAGDWRQWREAVVYKEAAQEVIDLEGRAEEVVEPTAE